MEEVDWRWARRELRVCGGRLVGVRMVAGSCLLLVSSGLVVLRVGNGEWRSRLARVMGTEILVVEEYIVHVERGGRRASELGKVRPY